MLNVMLILLWRDANKKEVTQSVWFYFSLNSARSNMFRFWSDCDTPSRSREAFLVSGLGLNWGKFK